jgi:hypothetical protein
VALRASGGARGFGGDEAPPPVWRGRLCDTMSLSSRDAVGETHRRSRHPRETRGGAGVSIARYNRSAIAFAISWVLAEPPMS